MDPLQSCDVRSAQERQLLADWQGLQQLSTLEESEHWRQQQSRELLPLEAAWVRHLERVVSSYESEVAVSKQKANTGPKTSKFLAAERSLGAPYDKTCSPRVEERME
jgi:hypothetical protein